MKTTASLFTGGGGFEIGAMMAGYRPIWGVEIRPDIAAVAERNIPGLRVIVSDVAAVDYASLPKVDHLHASPSCKNASNANSEGEEESEDLSSALAVCRAIRGVGPEHFTLENVWYYRTFESFKLILDCLEECGYHTAYWRLCAADYGVPQERYRLILVARKDRKPSKPAQTHYKLDAKKALKGMRSMFWEPWRGWYQAIEDLIPGLPETEPAPWQLARMPEEYKAILLAQGSYDGEVVNRAESEPAFTITANSNQSGLRAFLASQNGEYSTGFEGDKPAPTVTTQSGGRLRAFIMPGGGNTNFAEAYPGRGVRYEDEPAQTVTTVTSGGGSLPRAFVVGSHYAQSNAVKERSPQIRRAEEPYFTVTVSGGIHNDQRIFAGRWVSITPRCLARFQSLPDTYALPDANGLACEVIGNAVAPLLAKAICESLGD